LSWRGLAGQIMTTSVQPAQIVATKKNEKDVQGVLFFARTGVSRYDCRRVCETDCSIKSGKSGMTAESNVINRRGVGLRSDKLPDIAWCEVPVGKVTIGGDVRAFQTLPATEVDLPAFHIAKYPLTYQQFGAFIDDENGYANPKWWDALHEDALNQQRSGPDEQTFKFWNHPRENVSWYDAMAFSRWLSAKLGYEIRLPTEQEWEKAARGTDSRYYTYGMICDPSKANTYDGDAPLEQTNAVGSYPGGASPYGVEEMIGNVWEWTLNNGHDYPRFSISTSAMRVVRGGSWRFYGRRTRAASRIIYPPHLRDNHIGFRLAAIMPDPVI